MMLSDLYGRIGQILREHGDAPIGEIKTPMFANEPHHPLDYVKPHYCDVTQVVSDMGGVKIKTYTVTVEEM